MTPRTVGELTDELVDTIRTHAFGLVAITEYSTDGKPSDQASQPPNSSTTGKSNWPTQRHWWDRFVMVSPASPDEDLRKAKPSNGVHLRMVSYSPTEGVGKPEERLTCCSPEDQAVFMGKRRLNRLLLVVGLVCVFCITPSTSGFAASDVVNGVCDSNEICHFQNDNYAGGVADWNACEPNWSCGVSNFLQWEYYGTSTNVNDKIHSFKNRITATGTSTWAMIAENQFGGGQLICLPKGSAYPVLGGPLWKKDTSMWKSYNYC